MKVKNVQIITEVVFNTGDKEIVYKLGDRIEVKTDEGFIKGEIKRISNYECEIETDTHYVEVRYIDIEEVYDV